MFAPFLICLERSVHVHTRIYAELQNHSQVYRGTYLYALVQTGIYQYVPVYSLICHYVLVHTSTYPVCLWYILYILHSLAPSTYLHLCYGTREYIPQYNIPRKSMLSRIAVHTSLYRLVQVYRILRESAMYCHRTYINCYIQVHTRSMGVLWQSP